MVTLKDVAKKAGTSLSTTSIVLSGKGDERHISLQTQEKVLAAAAELSYNPSIAARRLRKGDTGNIVILIFWAEDFRASMIVRFLRGLQEYIATTDKTIELMFHFYKAGHLEEASSFTSPSVCNAAIICNTTSDDLAYLHNTKLDIPIVLYNRNSTDYCTVTIDPAQLGVLPAKEFLKKTFRSYVVITTADIFPDVIQREEAFVQTLLQHDTPISNIHLVKTDNTMLGGFTKTQETLEKIEYPAAIFCTSDNLAIGAVRAVHCSSYHFGQDVSLISLGNGDPDIELFLFPSLTVVHLPMEQMASSCMSLAIGLLEGMIKPGESIRHDVHMIIRESYF